MRCAWTGLAAPIVLVGVFTIEGALRPGYSALAMYVSALSLGPRGWIQITSFVVTGALVLAFAACNARRSRVGSILLAVIGAGILASGPFVMDPMGTPRATWTMHGLVHQLLGALVFMLMPITCWVFARGARGAFRVWCASSGVVILLAIIGLKMAPLAPAFGAIQRVALVTFFAWVFSLAAAARSCDW